MLIFTRHIETWIDFRFVSYRIFGNVRSTGTCVKLPRVSKLHIVDFQAHILVIESVSMQIKARTRDI